MYVWNTTNFTLTSKSKFREMLYLCNKHNQISTYFWYCFWLRHRSSSSSSSSYSSSSSSSSIGITAHCELWPVEQCPSIFSYLPPTLSIFSIPPLEDLFLLPLSIFSWVLPFSSSLPVLDWRSFWASYPPPFSLGDLTSLSFALLSILLYFLLCTFLLVLDSSYFSIPHFHILWHRTQRKYSSGQFQNAVRVF